ncbi:MAG TPA: ABC transporter ATP-binding protein [Candidatus Baltobacteraceae bacterium]|jgi:ABC-2 type transport system ATP-binding protein|nr:ABC transporter ATP-binding protein [Candidatus Baltobacteraceae bacterium]
MIGSNTTVSVRSLTRRFGAFVAVDDISFEIHAGEIWGFLGPNGSGKSTTIRMLCGVLQPTSGTACVLGYDVAKDPEAVKLRIGYMSQGATLWDDLTVDEHLRFYAGLFDMHGARAGKSIAEWTERVGLEERRNQLAGLLPGGYRKRLALACTLLHEPQMLFLDEPTSGVDPISRREFWDIIVGLAESGTTIMVTTHYLDEAEHCSNLALMYAGKLIAQGSPQALKALPQAGVTLEIDSPVNPAILSALDGLPFVRSASLYGSALHVTVDRAQDAERLRAALASKGYDAGSLPVIVPALEDVFAAIVEAA